MGLPVNMSLIDYTNAYIEENRKNGLDKKKFADMVNEVNGERKVSRPTLSKYLNGINQSPMAEEALTRFFESIGFPAVTVLPEISGNQSASASPKAVAVPKTAPVLSELIEEEEPAPTTSEPVAEPKSEPVPPKAVRKNGTIQFFYESFDARSEIGICEACQAQGSMAMIIGKSGYGKTFVLQHYARMEKVCYVHCDESMTSRDFIAAIEESIEALKESRAGTLRTSGTDTERIKEIARFFNSHAGHLLIIDEADKLMTRYNKRKMEIFRGLYDRLATDYEGGGNTVKDFQKKHKRTTGIVIAGELELENMLKMYLPRFFDRARRNCYKMKGLTGQEVADYLSDFYFTEEAMAEMKRKGTEINFRVLDEVILNILNIADPLAPITIEHVERASKMMV